MKESITIFLCGDVMTGRGIDQILPNPSDPRIYESYVKDARKYVTLAEQANGAVTQTVDYEYIWGDAMEVWEQETPALKIINLETSVTTSDKPWPGKGINYRMHPENIPVLNAADINGCTLANNHTLDWGREGLTETLQTLKKANINFAGAGKNGRMAGQTAIFNLEKGRVVLFSYGLPGSGIPETWAAGEDSPGINFLPDLAGQHIDEISRKIDKVKQPNDIIIFSVHWGGNWGYNIPEQQKRFAHQLIDQAGVDIIHGHSSHHPKGVEVYKEKLIIYGAGDFINDYEGISGHEQYRDELTLMYFPKIDPETGNLLQLKMVPMEIKKLRLNHPSHADVKWLHRTLSAQYQSLGTDLSLTANHNFLLKW